MKAVCTLVFLRKQDQVLLAQGTQKMNAGLRNGYGGKAEAGETVRQAAVREVLQEGGVDICQKDLQKVGVMTFWWPTETPDIGLQDVKSVELHIFLAYRWEGDPRSTAEMIDPQWYSIQALPYDDMFAGEKYWIGYALKGELFIGELTYFGPKKEVRDAHIRPVELEELLALERAPVT